MTTIMIIEDEKTSRFLLHKILTGQGYTVIEAASGREALEMLDKDRPDIIISDIMMPGMDGLEFAERVRQNPELKDIPIIMCTAKHDRETVLRALELGITHYIVKPIVAEKIVDEVKRLLKTDTPAPRKDKSVPCDSTHHTPDIPCTVDSFTLELPDYISSMREHLAMGSMDELKKEAGKIAAKAIGIGAEKLAGIASKIVQQADSESFSERGSSLLDELGEAAEAFLIKGAK